MRDDAAASGTASALPQPPVGWFDYRFSLLFDGTLALLRTDMDIHAENARWRAAQRSGETYAPAPKLWSRRGRLSIFDGSDESEAIEVTLDSSCLFDRVADGRWLVVYCRAEPGQTNA